MQTNLEQAKNVIAGLPPVDLKRFDEWYETEKRQKANKTNGQKSVDSTGEEYEKTLKWIVEHREEYLNKWVCLDGDVLIAANVDGHSAYQDAVAKGIKAPFLHFIEEEPEAYWGGWL